MNVLKSEVLNYFRKNNQTYSLKKNKQPKNCLSGGKNVTLKNPKESLFEECCDVQMKTDVAIPTSQ